MARLSNCHYVIFYRRDCWSCKAPLHQCVGAGPEAEGADQPEFYRLSDWSVEETKVAFAIARNNALDCKINGFSKTTTYRSVCPSCNAPQGEAYALAPGTAPDPDSDDLVALPLIKRPPGKPETPRKPKRQASPITSFEIKQDDPLYSEGTFYVEVPFPQRAVPKAAGLSWDRETKRWYGDFDEALTFLQDLPDAPLVAKAIEETKQGIARKVRAREEAEVRVQEQRTPRSTDPDQLWEMAFATGEPPKLLQRRWAGHRPEDEKYDWLVADKDWDLTRASAAVGRRNLYNFTKALRYCEFELIKTALEEGWTPKDVRIEGRNSAENVPEPARDLQPDEIAGRFRITHSPKDSDSYHLVKFTADGGASHQASVSTKLLEEAGIAPPSLIDERSALLEQFARDRLGVPKEAQAKTPTDMLAPFEPSEIPGTLLPTASKRWRVARVTGLPARVEGGTTHILARVPPASAPRGGSKNRSSQMPDYIIGIDGADHRLLLRVNNETFAFAGLAFVATGAKLGLTWQRAGRFWSIAEIPLPTLAPLLDEPVPTAPHDPSQRFGSPSFTVTARIQEPVNLANHRGLVPVTIDTASPDFRLCGQIKPELLRRGGFTVLGPNSDDLICSLGLVDGKPRIEAVIGAAPKPKKLHNWAPKIEATVSELTLRPGEDSGSHAASLRIIEPGRLTEQPCFIGAHHVQSLDPVEMEPHTLFHCELIERTVWKDWKPVQEWHVSRIHSLTLQGS